MIVYDLQCSNSHKFEGWFDDLKAFEKQQKQGLIACPVCDDTQVDRLPSTFAIKGQPPRQQTLSPKLDQAVVAHAIAEYVEKKFDNVGTDFAKEALKIHYGASQPRNIRGTSTDKEEETLRQEGVPFYKFPLPASSTSSSDTDTDNDLN